MGILSGFKKVKRYVKESSGYKLLSQWTSAQTVEMSDGTTLQQNKDWDEANSMKHTHSNKTVLDGITSDQVSKWDSTATNAVTGVKGAKEDTFRHGNVDITPENIGTLPSDKIKGGYQLKWYHPDYDLEQFPLGLIDEAGEAKAGRSLLDYQTGYIYIAIPTSSSSAYWTKKGEAILVQDEIDNTDSTIYYMFLALAQSINASQSNPNEGAVTTIAAGSTQDVGFSIGTMALFHGNKLIRLEIGYITGSPTTKTIVNKMPEGITITQYGPTQNPSYGFKVTNNTSKDITWLNIYMPSASS